MTNLSLQLSLALRSRKPRRQSRPRPFRSPLFRPALANPLALVASRFTSRPPQRRRGPAPSAAGRERKPSKASSDWLGALAPMGWRFGSWRQRAPRRQEEEEVERRVGSRSRVVRGAACGSGSFSSVLCPAGAAFTDIMISLTDTQKIGMGLTGFGVFFLFFGMILFFDKALLAIGNVLFVAGLAFVIGLERTFRFFFQKHKVKATGFFLGGVFIVLIGWPLIGMVFEIYGFFLLFRGFFPVVIGFIRRVPVLGYLLNLPGISSLVDKAGESNNMV
ncbi:Golgi transport 1B [Crotalus adamanteus]